MQNDNIYSEILQITKTKDDAVCLLGEIEGLRKGLYQVRDNSWEETLDKKVRLEIAREIRKSAGSSRASREVFLGNLTEKIKSLPQVDLTIAFEPTTEVITDIYDWLKQNIGFSILNIEIERGIVAGALISYKGKYFDGSIRKNIEEVVYAGV